MKRKRIHSILLIFSLILTLTSCFRKEVYIFTDGIYNYSGEEVQFYEDFYIDEVEIRFKKISASEALDRENVNILYDRVSKPTKYFNVEFLFKYTVENELKKYDFIYEGREPGVPDSFVIKLTIDNEAIGITGYLTISLFGQGKGYAVGIPIDSMSAHVRSHYINGIKNNDKYVDFPFTIDMI